jgi:RimJ/RimL family protein N-acetyltransferase
MTTRLIYGEEEQLLPWACERIGIRSFRKDAQAIGLERSGRLAGVVVFDTFSSYDCCIHVASDGSGHWLTAGFLRAVFSYPFVQCGLPRVTAPVAESNTRSLRFNKHLGFEVEGRHPLAAKDGAMITTALLRKNCIYIPKEYRT